MKSHMLSVIERKMCPRDGQMWSRDREGEPTKFQGLLSTEMKSRIFVN